MAGVKQKEVKVKSKRVVPHGHGSTGPKIANETTKEYVKTEISRMLRWGYTYKDIQTKLKDGMALQLSVPMICNYALKIREEYKVESMVDRRAMVREELKVLLDVRREAFMMWEKYKERGKKISKKERGSNDKGDWDKESVTTEDAEASQYLQIVLNTDKSIRELMSLDEAIKVDVTNTTLTLSWDQVMKEMAKPYRDEVGEVIEMAALPEGKIGESGGAT